MKKERREKHSREDRRLALLENSEEMTVGWDINQSVRIWIGLWQIFVGPLIEFGSIMRMLLPLALVSLLGPLSLEVHSQVSPPNQSPSQPNAYKLDPVTARNASYPAEARGKNVEGEVVATFVVSQTGEVTNVHAWSHNPTLTQAVEDAVAGWRFRPVTKDGKPIEVASKATFKFTLGDQTQIDNGVGGRIGDAIDLPKKVRVSSGVESGLILSKVNPIYPENARRNGIQGVVVLAVTIDRGGTITNLQPVSGPPELIPAAEEAVRQWHYKPYFLMGLPMEVETQIQINFTLRP
jgi:TonB family protein